MQVRRVCTVCHVAAPTLRHAGTVSSRMGDPRSVQEEKGDDAQHCQGRYHYTPVHMRMVHRAASSRSLGTRLLSRSRGVFRLRHALSLQP